MLEDTRKRGATIIMYVIFGVLIAGFVISFGPQSVGSDQGCKGPGKSTMVTLGDKSYGMPTWRWAFNTLQGGSYAGRVVQGLDALIKRELLAQEADSRGLTIDDSIIDEKIKRGEIYVLTEKLDGKRIYFEDGEYFNYKMLERWIGQYGMTISGFKSEQRRELLAVAMIDILSSAGHVSRDEAYALWLHSHTDVTIDAVSFPVEAYKAKLMLADADVDRYLAGHAAEIQTKYDADKALAYTGTTPRVKVRRVYVARTPEVEPVKPPVPDQPAPDPVPPVAPEGDGAGSGTGSGSAPGPTEPKVEDKVKVEPKVEPKVEDKKPDPAKVRLEAARADIVAKKKTLAEVAGTLDADEAIRGKKGLLGWLLPDAPGLGAPVLTEALKALVAGGEPSAVVETPDGFWLLAVEERREGDLSFDQVKREIASELAAEHFAREAARRAAIDVLADARADKGKNLADMFEKATQPAPPVQPELSPEDREQRRQMMQEQRKKLEQEMNDPSKSPEEREQLRQILEMIDSGQLGRGQRRRWESQNIPVEWAQNDDAPLGGAAPEPKDKKPAPPGDDIMKPSTDVLPTFAPMDKPKVARIGPMPRDRESLQDLGKAKDLVAALFDDLGDGALADRIYEVESNLGTAYVVVQVVGKSVPDPATFEEQSAMFVDSMREDRGREIVAAWLTARCKELDAKKAITIDKNLLTTKDEKGTLLAIPYEKCAGFTAE